MPTTLKMGNSHSKKPLSFEKLCELQKGSHTDKTKFVNIIAEVNKLAQKGKANFKKTEDEVEEMSGKEVELYEMKLAFKIQGPNDVLAMGHCTHTAHQKRTSTLKSYLKELYEFAYGSYDGIKLDKTGFGYS